MIGKKRNGKYPVYVYDPATRKKAYVGSYEKHGEARTAEAEARITVKTKRRAKWTVSEFEPRWFSVFHGPGTARPEYTTELTNRGQLKQFVKDFGHRRLDDIECDEARDWARSHPVGQSKTARAFYNDAIRDGKTDTNPFEKLGIQESRGRRDIHPITEAEVAELAQIGLETWWEYGPVVRAWVTFAAWVGCRPAEMFALEWDDLDLRAGSVRVERQIRIDGTHLPKTKRKRTIVLPDQAARAVVDMNRLRRGLVFTSPTGKQISKGLYRYYWSPVQERFLERCEPRRRAELLEGKKPTKGNRSPNLDLYELRHFCGSVLADRGLSARDIAHQLGNSAQVCEETYIHPYLDRVNERLRGAFAQPSPKVTELRERFGSEAADNA